MSAMKFIKNIFGFADKDYDTDDEPGDNAHTPYINPFKKQDTLPAENATADNEAETEETAAAETIDQTIYEELTEKIIETLNSGLPDYIKSCIDTDAEKEYVRSILDSSFSRCISRLKEDSLQEARGKWQSDRINLEQRTVELERQLSGSNAKIEELRGKNLSLERQKTTLNERVTQSESKAAKAEAEREQFQLECRSLMNKLKVSSISESRFDELTEENRALNERLKEADGKLKEAAAEKEEYEASVTGLQKECEIKDSDISRLQADKDSLQKQIEQLTEENQAKEAQAADNSAYEAKIAELQEEIASAKISQEHFDKQISDKDTEIDGLNRRLSDNKNEISHLNAAIFNLEESKRFGEEKLRQEIKLLTEENEKLRQELKESEEARKAAPEMVVFSESDTSYTAEAAAKPAPKATSKAGRRASKKKVVSAIDYTTDYSDWLIPSPPSDNIPITDEPEATETHRDEEPETRKNAPSQMELF